MQDVEKNFLKFGFDQAQIEVLLKKFELTKREQVGEEKIERLIECIAEMEFDDKPRLRINDRNLADDYVSETEWKKLYNTYETMENFCTILEKRLDVLFDAIYLYENPERRSHSINSKMRY